MPAIHVVGKYARIDRFVKAAAKKTLDVLPAALHKWHRPDGLASFVRDMIGLRKTISLCRSCEAKMPSRWTSRYNYELVKHLHADDCPCDYCRQTTSVNLYVAGEGDYWQQYDLGQRSVHDTVLRERKLRDKDYRYVLNF